MSLIVTDTYHLTSQFSKDEFNIVYKFVIIIIWCQLASSNVEETRLEFLNQHGYYGSDTMDSQFSKSNLS
jgi:hypothetical protein